MAKLENDLLECFIERLQDWASPDQCEALKRELRAEYAGKSYYVKKNPGGYRICSDPDSVKAKRR